MNLPCHGKVALVRHVGVRFCFCEFSQARISRVDAIIFASGKCQETGGR
jgi:hypothetical protein